ncbi:hypothetical protein F5Y06DRAFT_278123 [Hypoxylon sp. FL0890]|nr:hypothetical protein F5Y06DRAFT_278123 [Hypoxylon sp. FL0890]
MSETENIVLVVSGTVGIFFGCGHRFIKAVGSSPGLDKDLEDSLKCPLCYSRECLVCGACFSGWLDSCNACCQFCMFEAMADEAVVECIYKIRFEHGIILVPSVGNELSQVVGWTEVLLAGVGLVEFNEEVDADGEFYACEPMELELSEISRLDERGQTSVTRPAEPLKIEVRTVNTDVTPESDRHYKFLRLI